jgi:protein-L-isoaspartate(D-aspartate) O-methyltransferase
MPGSPWYRGRPDGDEAAAADPFLARRLAMVRDQLRRGGIRDEAVLAAFERVPRERFVPPGSVERAYADAALSIGSGQTISQPLMVAIMTEALGLSAWFAAHPGQTPRVLDVGTGSGYQAAILAEMGAQVISIERDEGLSSAAAARLSALGYGPRVTCVVGDGSEGYATLAPYDAIVVGAAAPAVPPPLVHQLVDGGRLVIPVGPRDRQELRLVIRTEEGCREQSLEACIFVPLIGRHGFPG